MKVINNNKNSNQLEVEIVSTFICLLFVSSYLKIMTDKCILQSAALIGDFNNWNPNADVMTRVCYLFFYLFISF